MKSIRSIFALLLALILLSATAVPGLANTSQAVVPTITIVSVDAGKSVTIETHNFPANDNFDVLMGKMGTRGVGGTKVETVSSGTGGSKKFTFTIPDALKNEKQIAIRLQSSKSGYYSYNWFDNKTFSSDGSDSGNDTGGPYPTFSITGVEAGKSVTIRTSNLPANDNFDVLMGKMGTRGVGGTKIETVSSGTGGSKNFTFTIPDALKNEKQIAIRLQSSKSGYYSYNWFDNATTGTGNPDTGTGGPYPTISITSVSRGASVTISTSNFPANDSFDVYMGEMGTRGVDGIKVTTVSSGTGGTLSFTFDIPASLKGKSQIAIRLQSSKSGYYSYNWFWNAAP